MLNRSKQSWHELTIHIVGAGPAGLVSAIVLSRLGAKVSIWEKEVKVERKVCGEYLSPMGVNLLVELGLGHTIADFSPVKGMKLVAPDGQGVLCDFPGAVGKSLNRQVFEQSLVDEAERLGISIFWGRVIFELTPKKRGWLVNGQHVDLVIGADGRRSVVAKTLGVEKGILKKKVALHAFIQRAPNQVSRHGEMHILSDGSYIGINPIDDLSDNVSWIGDAEILKAHPDRESFFFDMMKFHSALASYYQHSDRGELSAVYPISHQVTSPIGHDAILVGDAAGFLDPLTGEGLTRAIECAHFIGKAFSSSQSMHEAILYYARLKNNEDRSRKILNHFFQWVVKHPRVANRIGHFLRKSQQHANVFIGIIGNIYSPLQGILKLLMLRRLK
jgi:flavin-dependent dehydrogenase